MNYVGHLETMEVVMMMKEEYRFRFQVHKVEEAGMNMSQGM
ncbi:hypothetical protein [Rossellomorea vietnamensis]|nr:hypothetical protein [Rossellomorea vietnamensis]